MPFDLRHVLLVAGAVLILAVSGCDFLMPGGSGRARDTVPASLNEPFEMRPGQTAVLNDTDASLHFVGIPEDSRCPINVVCVWAGQVRVVLELRLSGDYHLFQMKGLVGGSHSDGRAGSAYIETEVEGYRISFLSLSPYPVFDPRTERAERGEVAVFRVARLAD